MDLFPDDADVQLYRKNFGYCGNLEPSGGYFVMDNNGKCYKPPGEETKEKFHELLMQSIKQGVNLFLQDYTEFNPYPEQNAVY